MILPLSSVTAILKDTSSWADNGSNTLPLIGATFGIDIEDGIFGTGTASTTPDTNG